MGESKLSRFLSFFSRFIPLVGVISLAIGSILVIVGIDDAVNYVLGALFIVGGLSMLGLSYFGLKRRKAIKNDEIEQTVISFHVHEEGKMLYGKFFTPVFAMLTGFIASILMLSHHAYVLSMFGLVSIIGGSLWLKRIRKPINSEETRKQGVYNFTVTKLTSTGTMFNLIILFMYGLRFVPAELNIIILYVVIGIVGAIVIPVKIVLTPMYDKSYLEDLVEKRKSSD